MQIPANIFIQNIHKDTHNGMMANATCYFQS